MALTIHNPTRTASPATTLPPPTIEPQAIPTPKLHALTSLRFFAAAMIVMLHAQAYFGAIPLLHRLTLTQGVCFFFVLSGFILTYAYPALDRHNVGRFLVARLARIVPLYLVALLLYMLILPAWYRDSVSSTTRGAGLLTATLLQAWVPLYRVQTAFNGVSWSLSVECFFYLCFPLLLWRWRYTWRCKIAATLLLTIGVIVVANHGMALLPHGAEVRDVVYFHPLARLFEFTLGVATAHLWRYLHPRLQLNRWLGTALEVTILSATIFVMIMSGGWARQAGHAAIIGPGGEAWLASSGFVCLPFAALIGIMACEWGYVSRLLARRPLVLLGEISFSLYLLHLLFCHYYVLHPGPFVAVSTVYLFVGYWIVVLLAAYVAWFAVEVPCRRAIVGLWGRHVTRAEERTSPLRKAAAHRVARPSRRSMVWIRAAAISTLLVALLGVQYAAVQADQPPDTNRASATSDTMQALLVIDSIGGQSAAGTAQIVVPRDRYASGAVTVVGWSVDETEHKPVRGILISIDDHEGVWAEYGSSRNDVSTTLGSTAYLHSGYIGALPIKGLRSGAHVVTVAAVTQDGESDAETHVALVLT